jgi:hypothetical protein
MQDHIEAIKEAVINGAHKEIEILVNKALEDKACPETIIN